MDDQSSAAGPHIVRVGGRGFDCNQFLIKDAKANAYDLVDAGHGMDFEAVLHEVTAVIEPSRVRSVAITHEHMDHVNGLPRWQALGAKVVASEACANKLHVGHDPTSAAFGMDIVQLDVDQTLSDGDHVALGGFDFTALATPGHAPGSMCFWEAGSATLFSGDTVFAEGGIGRFDFPDSNLAEHAESILRLSKLPARMLHCGHGPSVEDDAAIRSLQGSLAHVRSCL